MHIIDKIPVLTELPEALEEDSQICNKGKFMVGEAHNNLTNVGCGKNGQEIFSGEINL